MVGTPLVNRTDGAQVPDTHSEETGAELGLHDLRDGHQCQDQVGCYLAHNKIGPIRTRLDHLGPIQTNQYETGPISTNPKTLWISSELF